MKTISITPGENNVGAYVNGVNLNEIDKNLISQVMDHYWLDY